MRITKLKLYFDGDHTVLSATIGDFDLWFRCRSDTSIRESVDPFVAAALLPAMVRGTDIEVDSAYSVSEPLLNNLTELQEVFSCWNKMFRVVRVHLVTSSVDADTESRRSIFLWRCGLASHIFPSSRFCDEPDRD